MRKVYHIIGVSLAVIFVLGITISLSSSLIKDLHRTDSAGNDSGSRFNEFLIKKDEKPDFPKPVKILILGDMMFDRGVRSQINSKGFDYVFGPSADIFAKYDKVIANLEGPISSFESKTLLPGNKAIPGFQFTFPIETSDALKHVGIDTVSLANNHTYNFGGEGLAQTRTRLANSGVQYFGSPENNTDISTSTCVTIMTESGKKFLDSSSALEKKVCIGLIGWHEFGTKNYQKILNEISTMRPTVDYLVVFPHWGVEYEKSPTVTQIGLAHDWLNAGADAVIGAHPHVIQKIERYKTKDGRTAPIFYSLGNFIFDQYFSFDTTHGIAVEVTLASSTIAPRTTATTSIAESATYKIIPVESVGSRVSIPDASSTARMIKDIESVSGKSLMDWLQI